MKLVCCIVTKDDSKTLLDTLIRHGYRATVISTVGGFLKVGNVTILVGTEDEEIPKVLRLIKKECYARLQPATLPMNAIGAFDLYVSTVPEVEVGGATVFVLDVDMFQVW